jgi:hypothetical protein
MDIDELSTVNVDIEETNEESLRYALSTLSYLEILGCEVDRSIAEKMSRGFITRIYKTTNVVLLIE